MKPWLPFRMTWSLLLIAFPAFLAAQEPPSMVSSSSRTGSSSVEVGRFHVGAGGGYSGVSLAEAERNLEMLIRSEREYFEGFLLFWGSGVEGTPVARMEEVTGGSYLMTEAGYRVTSSVDVGVRFFRHFLPDLTGLYEERGTGGESIRAEHRFTAGLSRLLFGAAVERTFSNGRFLLRVGAHAGPVFLSSEQTLSFTLGGIPFVDPFSSTWTVPYSGKALGVDFGLQFEYAVRRGLGAVLEAGYSIANVRRLEAREDTDLDGDGLPDVRKGEPLEDSEGGTIECDLGGVRLGVALRARF